MQKEGCGGKMTVISQVKSKLTGLAVLKRQAESNDCSNQIGSSLCINSAIQF